MVVEEAAIEGEAEVSEVELYRASAYVPGPRAARNLLGMLALFWVGSSSGVVLGRPGLHFHDLAFLLVPPAIPFFVLLLLRRSWVRRVGATQGLGRTRFRFDARGLEIRSSQRLHPVRFGGALSQLKTPLGIWLYAEERRPLFVPRRAFDDEALRRLTPLLAERLPTQPERHVWLQFGCLIFVVLVLFLMAWHALVTVPELEEFRRSQEAAPASSASALSESEAPPH